MRAVLGEAIRRGYRVLRGGFRDSAPSVGPGWQTVEAGKLKGLDFYILRGSGQTWGDRIVTGQYEVGLLEALAPLASAGGVLYDVGAHIGFFTCAWVRLGGSRVEAFEPVPSTRSVLQETLVRNQVVDRVTIHNVALGEFNEAGVVMVNETDLGAASMAFVEGVGGLDSEVDSWQYRSSKPIRATIRRLDDIASDENLARPAALKIDVEGAEGSVLAGASRVLTEFRPVVLCEVHNIDSGMRAAHQLATLGYELRILGKNGALPVVMWWPL